MPTAPRAVTALVPVPGPGQLARKPTNLTLAVALVAEAKTVCGNISQAAEQGIAAGVAQRRQAQWLAENAASRDSSNTYAAHYGLPLARHRQF